MENDRINNIKNIIGMGNEIDEPEDGIVKFDRGNTNSGKGSVQIEESQDENGTQRKVVRDLGNGRKTVEITRVIKRNRGKGNS